MQIAWWYWIVAGVALMLFELLIPTLVLVWFGASAVVVGIVLAILPSVSLAAQLSIWLILSIAMVVLWFKVFKSGQHKTHIGLSAHLPGEIGLLVSEVAPFQKSTVRFQKPMLGSEVWSCIADQAIAAGERVKVVKVEGNMLKVEKA
jgi:membrane protein implicated in regulation of membrane protease activity